MFAPLSFHFNTFYSFCVCFFGGGSVPPCAVWHGGDSVCLDGSQAEKAISDRSDAGDGVIPMEGLIGFYSAFHSNR
jgi:hypothetical protein